MIVLKPTKRNFIFERFYNQQHNYRYFYFEEDYTAESEIEMFGYSKFTCDPIYDDDAVSWNYIVLNNKIIGIIALEHEQDSLRVKFLEIKNSLRNKGLGTAVIESLKNLEGYKSILLYPKNEDVAEKFYKPLGFVDNGKEELIYNFI